MTDKEKRLWSYFLNANGVIQYYPLCVSCIYPCKQSFRISGISCKKYREQD